MPFDLSGPMTLCGEGPPVGVSSHDIPVQASFECPFKMQTGMFGMLTSHTDISPLSGDDVAS